MLVVLVLLLDLSLAPILLLLVLLVLLAPILALVLLLDCMGMGCVGCSIIVLLPVARSS